MSSTSDKMKRFFKEKLIQPPTLPPRNVTDVSPLHSPKPMGRGRLLAVGFAGWGLVGYILVKDALLFLGRSPSWFLFLVAGFLPVCVAYLVVSIFVVVGRGMSGKKNLSPESPKALPDAGPKNAPGRRFPPMEKSSAQQQKDFFGGKGGGFVENLLSRIEREFRHPFGI